MVGKRRAGFSARVSWVALVAAGACGAAGWFFGGEHALLLAGIAAGVCVGLGLCLHAITARRLKRMCQVLERAEQRRFLERLPADRADVLGELAVQVNKLLTQLTDLNVRTIDQDRELRFTQERLELRRNLDRTSAKLGRRLREHELLAELAGTFTSTLEIDEVLRTVCKRVAQTLEIDEVAFVLHDRESDDLVVAAAHGLPEKASIEGLRIEIGEGVTGALWSTETMVYVPDVSKDERYLGWKGRHEVASGSMAVFVAQFQGSRLGLLDCLRLRPDGFSKDELRMLSTLAGQAAIAVRNARLYQQTVHLATRDELTGLLNRRRLFEILEDEWARHRRFGGALGVLVVDIDHFKRYNDAHGHMVGDLVLSAVARALAANLRQVDVVARYGGEEFVALLPRTSLSQCVVVAEKLRAAVADLALPEAPGLAPPTVSVGACAAEPAAATFGPLELLGSADHALLRAKALGRNRVEAGPAPPPGSGPSADPGGVARRAVSHLIDPAEMK